MNIFTFLISNSNQNRFLINFGLLGASLGPPKAIKIGWYGLPRRVKTLPDAMLSRTWPPQTAREAILARFEPPWGLQKKPKLKNTIFQDESKIDFSNATSSRKHGGGAAKHLDKKNKSTKENINFS